MKIEYYKRDDIDKIYNILKKNELSPDHSVLEKEYHYFPSLSHNQLLYLANANNDAITFTLEDTRAAISKGYMLIATTQSTFITADLIKSGYVIYIHASSDNIIKIDKNTMVGSERIATMKSSKSIEKYVLHDLLGLI